MENLLAIFFTVLITDFVAEFGDKTQLLLIGMTSKYKMRDIFLGTLFANVVLNAIAVFIGIGNKLLGLSVNTDRFEIMESVVRKCVLHTVASCDLGHVVKNKNTRISK